ncbi:aminopeptidase P family protein [Lichenicoccus sp.]|uniref:aminopeptidase P family protein n=1 Tax=Lichenicoccus sp. TaxID=2781899 RepID=UPI003D0C4876
MTQDHAPRLQALRTALDAAGLDGFILPRGDEHLGEYVAAGSERLAWLTGFTGSAGLAIVLPGKAAVFSDGRYTLQLAEQTDGALWSRQHLIEHPPEAWLAENADGLARIGYDPWLMSPDTLARFEARLKAAGIALVPVQPNPLDALWTDRPPPPLQPARPHALELSGRDSADKRHQIAGVLRAAGEQALVLTDPASVAWLLNIRGADVPFTPLALGFAILRDDESVILFMHPAKLDADMRQWLGNTVQAEPPEALPGQIAALAGQTVRVDAGGSAVWFAQGLRAAGATVGTGPDPVLLAKSRKNAVELAGARSAHHRDGIALCGFLHWLDGHGVGLTEMALAARLDAFRAASPLYRGESFPAISGSGPNGAIIHYRVSPETDRTLEADEIYLIDSGAQYPDGTTDVTRTIWSGPGPAAASVRDHFTRVLRGHVAIAATCFPQGATGGRLDSLARAPLWAAGLDYDHGTGHGIGSFLSVHEGPCSIHPRNQGVPLEPGMILSDEPGYYRTGAYGIRLENLLLVQAAAPLADAQTRMFLEFETLTLAPFDRRLIETALLHEPERRWIDRYHARVLSEIGPELDPAACSWLQAACAPL